MNNKKQPAPVTPPTAAEIKSAKNRDALRPWAILVFISGIYLKQTDTGGFLSTVATLTLWISSVVFAILLFGQLVDWAARLALAKKTK